MSRGYGRGGRVTRLGTMKEATRRKRRMTLLTRAHLAVVVLLLGALLALGVTAPAEAHTGTTTTAAAAAAPSAAPDATRGTAPAWAHRPGGPSNVTTDWSWWTGSWTVKFNWAETRQMSRGFGYCTAIASLASPTAVGAAIAAGCSIGWVIADIATNRRQCLKAVVPVSLINASFGYWGCPT